MRLSGEVGCEDEQDEGSGEHAQEIGEQVVDVVGAVGQEILDSFGCKGHQQAGGDH